jgi:hypothetical protein
MKDGSFVFFTQKVNSLLEKDGDMLAFVYGLAALLHPMSDPYNICDAKFGDSNGDCDADLFGIPLFIGGVSLGFILFLIIRFASSANNNKKK